MNSKTHVHTVHVEFGDCDPAGIVWFPNFLRWIDAASRHYFVACGVPPWTETARTLGVIGTPIVNTQTRFVASATYGDTLDIETRVAEWRSKSFAMAYSVKRGDTLILECEEVRIFGGRREDGSLCALPVPAEIRQLCGG